MEAIAGISVSGLNSRVTVDQIESLSVAVMPPILQADLLTFWQGFNRSCVRPLGVAVLTPRAGMLFGRQGPHRFRELCCSRPGTGYSCLEL